MWLIWGIRKWYRFKTLRFCHTLIIMPQIPINLFNSRPTLDVLATSHRNVWVCLCLCVAGFVGGIFSALCGCGVDIASFSLLCLLFRMNEKVAVPTAVVLMAINSFVGRDGLKLHKYQKIVKWEILWIAF